MQARHLDQPRCKLLVQVGPVEVEEEVVNVNPYPAPVGRHVEFAAVLLINTWIASCVKFVVGSTCESCDLNFEYFDAFVNFEYSGAFVNFEYFDAFAG